MVENEGKTLENLVRDMSVMSILVSGHEVNRRFLGSILRARRLGMRRNKRLGWVLLALAVGFIATGAVVFATRRESLELRLVEVHLSPANVPQGYIVSQVTPTKVIVSIVGPRSAVHTIAASEVLARVDLTQVAQDGEDGLDFVVTRPVTVQVIATRPLKLEVSPGSAEVTLRKVAA